MPVRVEWYLEDRIIWLHSSGVVTAEEAQGVDPELVALFDQSSAEQVHVIVDNSEAERMPAPTAFMSLQWPKHPKLGWSVVYGEKRKMIKFITATVAQLFKAHTRIVETFDEAVDALQLLDPTLPKMDH